MDTQSSLIALRDTAASLEERQSHIESLSRGLGVEQFWKSVEKAREGEREGNTSYGSQLISHGIKSVAEEIVNFTNPPKVTGQKTWVRKFGVAAKYLRLVRPEVAAFLALKAILDGITTQRLIQQVALDIGGYIEDEVRFSIFEEMEKAQFERAKKKTKKATTYMRVSELFGVDARDVAYNEGVLLIYGENANGTKNGDFRSVPMTSRVQAIFARRKFSHGDRPFPFDNFQYGRMWEKVRTFMGMDEDKQFIPHTLRHTCASRLVQRGISLKVVQEWMGHKTIQMTQRYAHLYPKDLMNARDALEQNAPVNAPSTIES